MRDRTTPSIAECRRIARLPAGTLKRSINSARSHPQPRWLLSRRRRTEGSEMPGRSRWEVLLSPLRGRSARRAGQHQGVDVDPGPACGAEVGDLDGVGPDPEGPLPDDRPVLSG